MVNTNRPVWDDIGNYKSCRKKLYDIHACIPPKGTLVINKLEQADVVAQLNGKTFVTVHELNILKVKNQFVYKKLADLVATHQIYMTSDKEPCVLCGTVGEMWTISLDKLAKKYDFVTADGTEKITPESIKSRMSDNVMDWKNVRTVPDNSTAWACFVPANQRGQIPTAWGTVLNINGQGVPHGKGDFVIAEDVNGKPNGGNRWVVNGLIFATTYNNKGWTDYLDTSASNINLTIDKLPKLCDVDDSEEERGMLKDMAGVCKYISKRISRPFDSTVAAMLGSLDDSGKTELKKFIETSLVTGYTGEVALYGKGLFNLISDVFECSHIQYKDAKAKDSTATYTFAYRESKTQAVRGSIQEPTKYAAVEFVFVTTTKEYKLSTATALSVRAFNNDGTNSVKIKCDPVKPDLKSYTITRRNTNPYKVVGYRAGGYNILTGEKKGLADAPCLWDAGVITSHDRLLTDYNDAIRIALAGGDTAFGTGVPAAVRDDIKSACAYIAQHGGSTHNLSEFCRDALSNEGDLIKIANSGSDIYQLIRDTFVAAIKCHNFTEKQVGHANITFWTDHNDKVNEYAVRFSVGCEKTLITIQLDLSESAFSDKYTDNGVAVYGYSNTDDGDYGKDDGTAYQLTFSPAGSYTMTDEGYCAPNFIADEKTICNAYANVFKTVLADYEASKKTKSSVSLNFS